VNWLTPVNDFWENSFIDRNVFIEPGPFKPTFYLDEQGSLKGPIRNHGQLHLQQLWWIIKERWQGKDASRGFELLTYNRWMQQLPPADLKAAEENYCPATEVTQADLVTAQQTGHKQVTVRSSEAVALARSHFAPFSVPPSARETYQVQLTRKLMQAMAEATRAHGGGFLAFYPYGTDMDKAIGIAACVKDLGSGHSYALATQDLLAPLKKSDPGFEFLTPHIESVEATSVSSTDWHLTKHGNELALTSLAKLLAAHGFLSPR
jgi:hypothetical protein